MVVQRLYCIIGKAVLHEEDSEDLGKGAQHSCQLLEPVAVRYSFMAPEMDISVVESLSRGFGVCGSGTSIFPCGKIYRGEHYWWYLLKLYFQISAG